MRKPPSKPEKPVPKGIPVYPDMEAKWPNLTSFLFDTKYDDGSTRITGTLLLFVQDHTLKVCLNDRDAHRSTFLAVDGPLEALDALELGLLEDTLDWRQKRD